MSTILVVEDEDILREVVFDYLTASGYKVLEAADGEQALELFNANSVDLVILDIVLPKIDGWSVCRRIRKQSNVPIIILTARSDEDDSLLGYELGADDYLFVEQIRDFQAKLLSDGAASLESVSELVTAENLVEYKIVIQPIEENGEPGYIFAMTSLQPVGEAIGVMQEFYPYLIGFTFLSVVLLAFFFSKWLTKPLIAINETTGKIAQLDFSEKLPVRSGDEIGKLSRNINYLSDQMESYITQLKKDLDKERQLENVRREFIANVSHELKTPLAVMRSCLSILRDGIAVEKKEHYFQAMENEVERMDALVANMLDLAKFASGTYKPSMAPFRIDHVVNDVCRSLTAQMQAKNVNIKRDLLPMTVVGHEGLISRVINNFLSNAIRHTPSGKTIAISVEAQGEEALISVENEGSRILDDDMARIWTQFYRSDRTGKSGTGLGLSISKEILELHCARYTVENTENGVRFSFTLPIEH